MHNAVEAAWVPNRGGACTTAAVLSALTVLGARGLPGLGEATVELGAHEPYGAPALLDYVRLPRHRAPLDVRVEALARLGGIEVTSRSGLVVPFWPLRPRQTEQLVANLAWGQEAPGRRGSWGWHVLRPRTYWTGGHSVLVVGGEDRGWLVLDSNHRGLQRWDRPGVAITATRIARA